MKFEGKTNCNLKKNIEKDLGIYRVVEITCEISTGISLCTKKWHIILIKWYDVSEEKRKTKISCIIQAYIYNVACTDRYMVSVYRI